MPCSKEVPFERIFNIPRVDEIKRPTKVAITGVGTPFS